MVSSCQVETRGGLLVQDKSRAKLGAVLPGQVGLLLLILLLLLLLLLLLSGILLHGFYLLGGHDGSTAACLPATLYQGFW